MLYKIKWGMNLLSKIFIILSIICFSLMGGFFYMGVFQEIKVTEKSIGPNYFVYIAHQGTYNKAYNLLEEAKKYAIENKIQNPISAGVYFDDPAKVEESKLRSELGVFVSQKEFNELSQKNTNKNINYRIIDPKKYLYTTFPNKNFLSMILAVFKVYPAFEKFYNENKIISAENEGYALEVYHSSIIEYYLTKPVLSNN